MNNAAMTLAAKPPAYLIPLKSPMADVLSQMKEVEVVTFSGHLFYNKEIRFYEEYKPYDGWYPRTGNTIAVHETATEQYLHMGHTWWLEFTRISK